MHLLFHSIDDVVHATGSERADGYDDHGEANQNFGKRAALRGGWRGRHCLRRTRHHRWRRRLRSGGRRLGGRRRCLPEVGSALVAKSRSARGRAALVAEFGPMRSLAGRRRENRRGRNWSCRGSWRYGSLRRRACRQPRTGCKFWLLTLRLLWTQVIADRELVSPMPRQHRTSSRRSLRWCSFPFINVQRVAVTQKKADSFAVARRGKHL